ncbi:target of Myb protein 1-like isoform X1 [Cyprinus carpio]|uniref:Target of Myb protein 1-like isoform X1 n=1 Tax=Cyprinus carpio TaxID=7962 RepID=A0A9Q9Y4A8_CYPCA|nr:target of Myb protein 1-like isoform X1 [Cyprinus carpio]
MMSLTCFLFIRHHFSQSIPENGVSSSSVSPSQTNSSPATHTPRSDGQRSPEVKQKLRSELDLVKGNLSVMTEMLNHIKPGETSASDAELLQQLYSVCKQMQQRVVELIPNLSEDEMIGELLQVNDDLNNAFIRYERFDRLNVQRSNAEEQQESQTETENLIDLRPESPSPNQNTLPAVNQHEPRPASDRTSSSAPEDEEFDMFAQSRSSSLAEQRKSVRYEDPGAVEGLAEALDTRLQVTAGGAESDWVRQSQWIYSEALAPAPRSSAMDEIERWLSAEMPDVDDSEGVTSEEFDQFLAGRAQAADHLPSMKSSSSVGVSPSSPRQAAQEQNHEQIFRL